MKKTVQDRRDDNSGHDHEYETAKQRVARSEQLACIGVQCIDRAHPAKDHRSVQNGVYPLQLFDGVITKHADSQCNDNENSGESHAFGHPAEEGGKRDQLFMVLFKHEL